MPKDNAGFFKRKNEWSEIKDRLLECYLLPYFQKVITNGRPVYYVDCFAGKGVFEDGKPGSPIIALKARDICLDRVGITKNNNIDCCFIELNHADELIFNVNNYIKSSGRFVEIVSGKYEDEIDKILCSKIDFNVFLYIDPYGIKALDFDIFNRFEGYKFRSFEMLINFNTFGFFRDACRVMNVKCFDDEALQNLDDLVEYDPTAVDSSKRSEMLLIKIAGGDYWKDIVAQYNSGRINGYAAERLFSTEYKKILQNKYRYVLDMPIRLKPAQRPKYRMIHVSNHEDGCYLMGQNMQSRKDELFLNVQQNGTRSLLDCFSTESVSIENEIIPLKNIKNKIKRKINKFDNIRLKKLIAIFINKHGLICNFKTIHSILKELEDEKYIKIFRNPEFTNNGKKSIFWDEGKGRQITIRRNLL